MPLPVVMSVGAVLAGTAGLGSGVHGTVKLKSANDTMKIVQERHQNNLDRLEQINESVNIKMDALGKFELQILKGFETFSDTIEKLQSRPQFQEYCKGDMRLPLYDKEELEKVSVGAGILLAGLGSAVLGTAGGFAAAGAVTSAVMALGTASTGTAISSLSGAAATNAVLAAIGGGTIAIGGGGVVLGTTVLSAASLGVGLLVGGSVFNYIGGKLSNEADEAYAQMERAERITNEVCINLMKIAEVSDSYYQSLKKVYEKYLECFEYVFSTVNRLHKEDWNTFTDWEKRATQNTVLLVGILYKMCQVNLMKKNGQNEDVMVVNQDKIENVLQDAEHILKTVA